MVHRFFTMLFGTVFTSSLAFGISAASVLPASQVEKRGWDENSRHGWHKGLGWGHDNGKTWNDWKHNGWSGAGWGWGKPPRDCKNGPNSRRCWKGDLTIETDSEERWPNTGKTVHYALNITNQTLAPDGTPRSMLVINGQYPGPMIIAGKSCSYGRSVGS